MDLPECFAGVGCAHPCIVRQAQVRGDGHGRRCAPFPARYPHACRPDVRAWMGGADRPGRCHLAAAAVPVAAGRARRRGGRGRGDPALLRLLHHPQQSGRVPGVCMAGTRPPAGRDRGRGHGAVHRRDLSGLCAGLAGALATHWPAVVGGYGAALRRATVVPGRLAAAAAARRPALACIGGGAVAAAGLSRLGDDPGLAAGTGAVPVP
ncbi:hypothetical protein G6F68_012796 [Rhizopus microsporus]|nr:hypothetical protein G6F31_012698 [Rhizopus arrhizus]KAG1250450.1 hypothetical protein G6F68_012796 [Rhizopus microsporus]